MPHRGGPSGHRGKNGVKGVAASPAQLLKGARSQPRRRCRQLIGEEAGGPGRYQLRLSANGGYNPMSGVVVVDVRPAERQGPGPAAVAGAVGLVAVAMVLFGGGRRRTRREGQNDAMRRGSWPAIGLVVGAVVGWLWGWFGSGGYEAMDSAVGTSFLCALAGLLIGAVAYTVADRRSRRRP